MITRRNMLKASAAVAVCSVLPLTVTAATTDKTTATADVVKTAAVFDYKQAIQRFDLFLTDLPTERELDICFSGKVGGKYKLTDQIGDIVRRCGGVPDWEETLRKRKIALELEAISDLSDPPEMRDLSYRIPIVSTKCGITISMERCDLLYAQQSTETQNIHNGIVEYWLVKFTDNTTEMYDKFQFGPPADATWVEKIYYGEKSLNMFCGRADGKEFSSEWTGGTPNHTQLLTKRTLLQLEAAGVDMEKLYHWSIEPSYSVVRINDFFFAMDQS